MPVLHSLIVNKINTVYPTDRKLSKVCVSALDLMNHSKFYVSKIVLKYDWRSQNRYNYTKLLSGAMLCVSWDEVTKTKRRNKEFSFDDNTQMYNENRIQTRGTKSSTNEEHQVFYLHLFILFQLKLISDNYANFDSE